MARNGLPARIVSLSVHTVKHHRHPIKNQAQAAAKAKCCAAAKAANPSCPATFGTIPQCSAFAGSEMFFVLMTNVIIGQFISVVHFIPKIISTFRINICRISRSALMEAQC